MARDEEFPDEKGVDRRTFVKAAVGIGAVGLAGSLVASGKSLLPPPIQPVGEVNEGFVYAKGDTPNPFGFDTLAGRDARPEHFREDWVGTATLWRALLDAEGKQIPGTGFPVLLIRVDPNVLEVVEEWVAGRDFLKDPAIVAVWDRCVHLCCLPQWRIEKLPPSYQDYDADRVPRTLLSGVDPIWCRCHNSQYDPANVVWDVHPNGTIYLAANLNHGPATRGLPVVPIEVSGGRIVSSRFTAEAPQPPESVVEALRGRPGRIFRDWYFAYCR